MSFDYTLDELSNWIHTKGITYCLVSWHWITLLWANTSEFIWKTVRGIRDAHIPDYWYFCARNECPWPLKESQRVDLFSAEAMWTPAIQRMYFRENCQSGTTHSFNDVVTAELYNSDKSVQYDVSSFFHTFSWRSVRAAPSLYEVVLLYCLTHNLIFRKSQLEDLTLEVLTAEGESIKQSLSSTKATENFDTWEKYKEADDSSVEATSD